MNKVILPSIVWLCFYSFGAILPPDKHIFEILEWFETNFSK